MEQPLAPDPTNHPTIELSGKTYPVAPGTAVYVPPKAPHATRRTGPDPVKLVYAHGAV